ncbi:MAG: HAMP domain-containing protein [Desulfobacterales bacterium]|nr:HAMP domain-containing protein [Desulfobacterales bacterium]
MVPKKTVKRYKRRQYYIKPGFQTRFTILFLSILIMGGVVSLGLTLAFTQDSLTSTYVDSKLVIQNTSLAIMPSVIFTTVLTTLGIGSIAALFFLVISHKIAGPIHRFELDIQRVAKGDLATRIRIRKNDQFQELAISLNQMISALNERVLEIKKETEVDSNETGTGVRIKQKIDDKFKL